MYLGSEFISFLIEIQKIIGKSVEKRHLNLSEMSTICCCDVAYNGDQAFVVTVVEKEGKRTVFGSKREVKFPYRTGLLSFREGPLLFESLREKDCDVILVDGHGLTHPRKAGLATTLGVILKKPVIGVAKSKLYGEVVKENGVEVILVEGERVGVKFGKYYYSIGNLVDFESVLDFGRRGYPECLKEADRLSKDFKRRGDLFISK
ncbi:endonuclease V [Sulfolobales archaeon HS-7]|nr:endonuclease V [Sulfolobales archaeon HS-7]